MSLTISRFLRGLSDRYRLLAFLVVVVAASLLLAFHTGGVLAMVGVGVAINLLLFISRGIWLPPDYGRTGCDCFR